MRSRNRFRNLVRDSSLLLWIFRLYYWSVRPVLVKLTRSVMRADDFQVNFLIAGVAKAGTTAVFESLRQAEGIALSCVKEVKFFSYPGYYARNNSRDYYHSFFKKRPGDYACGEASPSYFHNPGDLTRIKAYNPAMKIIVIVRNPTERAYSNWNMRRQKRLETASFSQAIADEMELLATQGDRACLARGYSYLLKGQYAERLAHLWSLFPRRQTLILKYDDMKEAPQETFAALVTFLGGALKTEASPGIPSVHVRSYTAGMDLKTRELLHDYYRRDIRQLEKILGWNCSSWLR